MRSTVSRQPSWPQNWKSAPLTEDPRRPLIVFGDAMFGKENRQEIKGHKSGVVNIV